MGGSIIITSLSFILSEGDVVIEVLRVVMVVKNAGSIPLAANIAANIDLRSTILFELVHPLKANY